MSDTLGRHRRRNLRHGGGRSDLFQGFGRPSRNSSCRVRVLRIRINVRRMCIHCHYSVNGCLIQLTTPVKNEQTLLLKTVETQEELFCRVEACSASENGLTRVKLVFISPSPRFWNIHFWSKTGVTPAKRRNDFVNYSDLSFLQESRRLPLRPS